MLPGAVGGGPGWVRRLHRADDLTNDPRGKSDPKRAPQAEDSMDKGGETGKRMASLCDKQLDTNRTLSAKEDKENEDGCAVRDEIPKTE